jgi:PAS domain S-box-containing protein
MSGTNKRDLDFPELRKKAEQMVGERREGNPAAGDAELVRLINELDVYQAELELQNEELDRSAEELKNARNEWFELFDTAPVGFVLLDESNMIDRCNRKAGELLSGNRFSMSGHSFLSRIHPDDREAYLFFRRALERSKGALSSELRLVKENDQIVYVHVEASVQKKAEGENSRCRLALVDISDRKAYEKALKRTRHELENRVEERTAELGMRNRQLSRLTSQLTLAEQRERSRLADVLHDHLQQLLAGARLHLEILSRETGVGDVPAYKSVYDLLIESLKVSRSLASELSPPVLYQKEFPDAIRWLARWMDITHRLKVELHLPGDFPFLPEELRVLLFYSIRELLFNVVKHSETASAQVTMHGDDGRVRISVSDKGRGCDPQRLTGNDSGEGFGLFAIRERVELFGGDLEIDGAPNAGTTVTISLPVEPPGYEQPEPPAPIPGKTVKPPADFSPSSKEIRVMLVDDHAVMRKGLSTLLSAHDDIEVVGEAASGEEAVEEARRIQPEVILMDINMPGMNGVEATRRITSEIPGIRIYGLSMHEAGAHAHAMAEAGAAGYLSKSGSSDALLTAIRGKTNSGPSGNF